MIPTVQGVSTTGELTITFNKDMLIEDGLKTDSESDDDETARAEFPISQVLSLAVISSYYDDADSSKIDIDRYSLISYESRALTI